MLNLRIIRATQKDAKKLLEIERATASKTYSTVKDISQTRTYLNKDIILWLYDNKEIAGKISYSLLDGKTLEISGLIILPAYSNKGYGKYLVNHVINLFPNIVMKLTVHPENESAISLYRSLGFIAQGTLANPYGDGEPRLLMIKNPAVLQK